MFLLHWEDALSDNGAGCDPDDIKDEPVIRQSVGFLVRRNRKVVILAQSTDIGSRYQDFLIVPAKNVKKARRLR